jgi:hypothetical protein
MSSEKIVVMPLPHPFNEIYAAKFTIKLVIYLYSLADETHNQLTQTDGRE